MFLSENKISQCLFTNLEIKHTVAVTLDCGCYLLHIALICTMKCIKKIGGYKKITYFIFCIKCVINALFLRLEYQRLNMRCQKQRLVMKEFVPLDVCPFACCDIFVCAFVSGCCFVTFFTRKAALKAQDALHNIKTLSGVSASCNINL